MYYLVLIGYDLDLNLYYVVLIGYDLALNLYYLVVIVYYFIPIPYDLMLAPHNPAG